MAEIFGGIVAGGTKFICATGRGPQELNEVTQIPTTTPAATLEKVINFFRARKGLSAIGIGSFGPVDLEMNSPAYGYITDTPKPDWAHTDLAGTIGRALGIPIGFDTDVN